MLRFNPFAECVDPRGYFLMVAIDLLVQLCKPIVNLIKLSAGGVKSFFHGATQIFDFAAHVFHFITYVLYLVFEFVNSIIDSPLDSAEVSG